MVNIKGEINVIRAMEGNGNLWLDQKVIKEHIGDFYTDLFSCKTKPARIVKDIVPNLVSDNENSALVAVPNDSEFRKVVFSLDPNSTPGPNEIDDSFYHHCWDIIGLDIYAAIKEFFSHY